MVTDQQLLNEVQYHTIETPNMGWIMSTELWTIAEVIAYLNDRVRRFISETKVHLVHANYVTTPGVDLYYMNEVDPDMVDLFRVAWLDSTGYSYELQRSDELPYDSMTPDWVTTPGSPLVYNVMTIPNMVIQVIPYPGADGQLDLLYTAIGSVLSNSGVTIPLPDDLTPYPKWGVVADMLKKDGPAHDMVRAEYCEMRFQEGVELTKILVGEY